MGYGGCYINKSLGLISPDNRTHNKDKIDKDKMCKMDSTFQGLTKKSILIEKSMVTQNNHQE